MDGRMFTKHSRQATTIVDQAFHIEKRDADQAIGTRLQPPKSGEAADLVQNGTGRQATSAVVVS